MLGTYLEEVNITPEQFEKECKVATDSKLMTSFRQVSKRRAGNLLMVGSIHYRHFNIFFVLEEPVRASVGSREFRNLQAIDEAEEHRTGAPSAGSAAAGLGHKRERGCTRRRQDSSKGAQVS